MRGCQVYSGLVIIRSLYFIFVFSELCPLPRGLLPLPSLGVPHTSTPTPRSVEYSHGVPSPCNSHNGGSSPGLRVFHPSETLPLGLGPALPRTPPHGSPSPIARTTSPEPSQGAQGPWSPLPHAPERGVPRRRLGVTKTSTPGLGANSQVPAQSGSDLSFSSPSDWPFARDPQGAPKGAGATKLREFYSNLGLSHFESHRGLWTLPLPVVKLN